MTQMLGEISKDVMRFIPESPSFQEFPECQRFLLKLLTADEPWIHALPVLTCKAVGGEVSSAIPVAAAWITLVHAANVIDDIQDNDSSRLAQLENPQHAMTIAIAWIFAAFRILDYPSLDLETRNKITNIFASAGFDSSMGQFQDLVLDAGKSDSGNPLEVYWNSVILKSGSICKAGAAAGAAVGNGSAALVEALGDYGTALGVIQQVIDDCRDIWSDEKILEKKHTLPALLQSMVADQKFKKRVNHKDRDKPSEAQLLSQTPQLFVKAGVPEIIADILLEWRRRALESLNALEPSEARNALEKIIDHVMTPKLHVS
jgi:geranylgeranyl pyrophosphate synthase